jgi:hypothetical protein
MPAARGVQAIVDDAQAQRRRSLAAAHPIDGFLHGRERLTGHRPLARVGDRVVVEQAKPVPLVMKLVEARVEVADAGLLRIFEAEDQKFQRGRAGRARARERLELGEALDAGAGVILEAVILRPARSTRRAREQQACQREDAQRQQRTEWERDHHAGPSVREGVGFG